MRSKKNKIIIGVIALILCVAVGYAIFSETLKVEGTATASGSFDITMTCENTQFIGATGNCQVNDNTVTTTSEFSKPTDAAGFIIKVTNNGTIPAKLTTVSSNNNKKYKDSSIGNDIYLDDNFLEAYYDIRKYSQEEDNYDERICEGYFCSDDEIPSKNLILKPQESVYLVIAQGWLDSGKNEQPKLEGGTATMTYNVTLNFTQATNE